MKVGGGITMLSTIGKKKENSIQDSDLLTSSAEGIHDPVLEEFSRLHVRAGTKSPKSQLERLNSNVFKSVKELSTQLFPSHSHFVLFALE